MFPVLVGMLAAVTALAWPACADQGGVVLTYFRIDDDRVPATNTPLSNLDMHLAEMRSGGFKPMDLGQLTELVLSGQAVPDRAVALAIDGGSRTVLGPAWDRLKQAAVPVTLFVAVDEAERGGESLNWAQLREIGREPWVKLALLGGQALRGHVHNPAEFGAELDRVVGRFESELSMRPTLFAWPWGEMQPDLVPILRQRGFLAAFGQHSGPLWSLADPFFLPRYSMNGVYGESERFRVALRSRPLPVSDISPDDPHVQDHNPPAFGFTVDEAMPGLDHLACQVAHEGRVKVERLGQRVEIRMTKPLPKGRTRLNCTAPSLDGRWRWFGWLFWRDQ